jgi:hypothetical protein
MIAANARAELLDRCCPMRLDVERRAIRIDGREFHPAGAKEAAEKLQNLGELDGKQTSGAKGRVDFIAFTPEINLRPTLKPRFSAACKATSY